ncbi:endonuclease I family protein [Bacillus infantis]|uniref:endonuclease I family protein n=1 Tax=Bacillus infantis TaxID=324767 RepID=UPI003CFAD1E0
MNSLAEQLAAEQEAALANLQIQSAERIYYDEAADLEKCKAYYASIDFEAAAAKEDLQKLVEKTHKTILKYSPHLYLYPWVDLQENFALKSLYSGGRMDPAESIKHDAEILLKRNRTGDTQTKLNCEHVIPQSWFSEQQPMKGDLHHLFACEPACNSMRSNFPYEDFPSYNPEASAFGIRDGCGMAEEGKFEPEYGKGIAARACFYFFLRYKNFKPAEHGISCSILYKWHLEFPVSLYEKHRNAAIEELQGNRNPFIDFPELAGKLTDSN